MRGKVLRKWRPAGQSLGNDALPIRDAVSLRELQLSHLQSQRRDRSLLRSSREGRRSSVSLLSQGDPIHRGRSREFVQRSRLLAAHAATHSPTRAGKRQQMFEMLSLVQSEEFSENASRRFAPNSHRFKSDSLSEGSHWHHDIETQIVELQTRRCRESRSGISGRRENQQMEQRTDRGCCFEQQSQLSGMRGRHRRAGSLSWRTTLPAVSLRDLLLEGFQRASATNSQRTSDDESSRSIAAHKYSSREADALSVRQLLDERWQSTGCSSHKMQSNVSIPEWRARAQIRNARQPGTRAEKFIMTYLKKLNKKTPKKKAANKITKNQQTE